jgi:hypothetical protein
MYDTAFAHQKPPSAYGPVFASASGGAGPVAATHRHLGHSRLMIRAHLDLRCLLLRALIGLLIDFSHAYTTTVSAEFVPSAGQREMWVGQPLRTDRLWRLTSQCSNHRTLVKIETVPQRVARATLQLGETGVNGSSFHAQTGQFRPDERGPRPVQIPPRAPVRPPA